MPTINFKSGAFAAYEPDDPATVSRFIPFRFNPEIISRQYAMAQGQGSGGGTGTGGNGASDDNQDQASDANTGTLKETFSVLIRLDLAERHRGGSNIPAELGIAPEIAAIEDLMYPSESAEEQASDGSEPVQARPRRPIVLFIWGEKRVIPVMITGMTINESLYNNRLYPIRAELEVSLQVLGENEARENSRVQSSLDFTTANRRELAQVYFDNTSEQGTNVDLP